MRLEGGRRLPGRNLFLREPGSAVELIFDAPDEDPSAFLAAVPQAIARAFSALDLPAAAPVVRQHPAGLTLAVTAPEDALYAATEALEWATRRALDPGDEDPDDDALAALRAARDEERNPELLALMAAATERGIPALPDDDELSVGLGARSKTWPIRALPKPDEVDWDALGRIPVALITGTNGKTTVTRMVARMLERAGRATGYSSTDGLIACGELIEAGDWSGPGGARNVLRNQKVEAAALETARGGLLRRGLAVTGIDAACVTNIGADHFGEYGIVDLAGMAEAKALVGHAVRPGGVVVLNAADPMLVPYQDAFAAPVTFFALDKGAHPLARWYLDDGQLTFDGEHVVPVDEVPLTFEGAARHNVENALCAAAVGHGLGLSLAEVAEGLRDLTPNQVDSPGRANLLEKDGVRLLLDFAHNPAGVDAALAFVRALRGREPAGRLTVLSGQAGDRTDDEIRAVATSIRDGGADRVIVRELAGYLRGRERGEVPGLFRDALNGLGLDAVDIADDDVDGLERALANAKPGDFIAYLLLVDREGVRARLQELGW